MGLFSSLMKTDVEGMKTKKDVEGLIKALQNKRNVYVRMGAAAALGEMGDSKALDPLVHALKDPYRPVRDAATEALGKLGGDARGVEAFLDYVNNSNSIVREEGVSALGKIGHSSAVEPLIQILSDESFFVRQSAVTSLGKIGDARATEPLLPFLKDEDKDIREAAAQALGAIADSRAVESLVQTLKDESPRVRYEAAESLGKIGDRRAVEALMEATKDKGWIEITAAGAVPKKKSAGSPAGGPAKGSSRSWVRLKAIEALGLIGDGRAVPAVTEALNDKHEPVREAARQALDKLTTKPA